MKLALRHSLPANASTLHRASSAVIEARLVSRYAHAGIVIGTTLYHSNGAHGVHAEADADLSGYVLIDLGGHHDAAALRRFELVKGAGYDFFSLTAFAVAPATDSQRWYCYELAFFLMTGRNPFERVAPEALLLIAFELGGRLVTPLPPFKARPMKALNAAV